MVASIFVLAGVNGAGKSSVGGAAIEASGARYFNPDLFARGIRASKPELSAEAANGLAWAMGRRGLERAMAEGGNFAFETTLGGRTIADMLLQGAMAGGSVHMWFCGLASPELHIERVRNRVSAGGHDIPEDKIRERCVRSIENLIRLLPYLASLRVYDNSATHDPKAGELPSPVPVLHMERGAIVSHLPLGRVPGWAKPVLASALKLRLRGG